MSTARECQDKPLAAPSDIMSILDQDSAMIYHLLDDGEQCHNIVSPNFITIAKISHSQIS